MIFFLFFFVSKLWLQSNHAWAINNKFVYYFVGSLFTKIFTAFALWKCACLLIPSSYSFCICVFFRISSSKLSVFHSLKKQSFPHVVSSENTMIIIIISGALSGIFIYIYEMRILLFRPHLEWKKKYWNHKFWRVKIEERVNFRKF